ncbi:MAG TPA: type I-E CRISPR-associated protein Cse1/CasA [Candidatus Dormibacteraeota bacterium]|nr:type I-E CRISPR-associated protein Cse1/CasA [Candidatus Dormibacteraeota bacterium]
MFNLVDEQWLPARRADGHIEHIRPAEITSGIDTNPVVGIEWPRADFRIGSIEFLIGLIATACPPADDEEAWVEGWENPPSPEALAEAFVPLTHAFNLDGPGPRFLQDFDELPGEPDSPETLLIEASGANTRRNNTALLVKAGRITHLSRAAAAISLFTLQCYAPSGGRGNLTSVRGGGPLTTLASPGGVGRYSLWHLVWANTPRVSQPRGADLSRVFPWLAPTRTADRFRATTPAEAHSLQAFWGMPRRIRLNFADNAECLPCDLTGVVDPAIVTGWRQRPNGIKYVAWEHPLSPAYKDNKSGAWLPVHAQPGGIGYRHWLAIAVGDEAGTRRPARAISDWRARSVNVLPSGTSSRLFAAGYDMDNMKARAFVESEMPLPGTEPQASEAFDKVARRLVEAAGLTASALRNAVRQARFSRDTSTDSAPLASIYENFWSTTQDPFFNLIEPITKAAGSWEAALDSVAPAWHWALKSTALRVFDEAAPLDPSTASFDPRRIVEARRNLFGTLDGRGPIGSRVFEALQLPLPEPKGKQRRQSEAMGTG